MASGTTIATAYVQIMPSMDGITSSLTSELSKGMDGAGSAAGKLFGGKFAGMATKLLPVAAVGGAAVLAGKALMDIGSEFDAMTDAIIIGTGASGEALEGLVSSAEDIATSVPISFEQAGDYVQNLNTRLGLTGDELVAVGERTAALGQLFGTEINLDKLTGAMNAFGVADDEVADKMDFLFKVGQDTGIAFDDLTGAVEKNAPSLKELGFSLEESALLAGQLDKAGLDASGTMGKLTKVLQQSAKDGVPAREAYENIISQLEEYIETGDDVAALDLAQEVFGTRGAAQFLDAVKQGALSLDNMAEMAEGASDSIMSTMRETEDWPEKWERIKNQAKLALEPLASGLMDSVTDGLERLSNWIADNEDKFEGFRQVMQVVAGVVSGVLGAAFEAVGLVLTNILSPALDAVISFFTALYTEAIEPMLPEIQAFADEASAFIEGLADTIGGAFQNIMGYASELGSFIDRVFTSIRNTASNIWNTITTTISTKVSNISSTVSNVFNGISSTVSSIFNGIKSTASSVWNAIKSAIETPINAAKNAVSTAINAIKGFFNFKISWPHIPVPHFSVSPAGWSVGDLLKGSIPSLGISWYAKGGIVNGATLIGAGEAGPEMILPANGGLMDVFAERIASEVDGDTYNIYLQYDAGADANQMARDLARSVKRLQLARG